MYIYGDVGSFTSKYTGFFPRLLNADLEAKRMENRYQTSWKATQSR